MKRLVHLTAFLLLWPVVSAAQTMPRDKLIDRVESIYFQNTVFSTDSPFVDMLLKSPKLANPGVSNETWLTIRQEVASTLTKVMTERGGLLDTFLRKSMEPLSDAELSALGQILSDPAYVKFQSAMASPSTQREFAQTMFGNAAKINAAINSVLVSHGLIGVH